MSGAFPIVVFAHPDQRVNRQNHGQCHHGARHHATHHRRAHSTRSLGTSDAILMLRRCHLLHLVLYFQREIKIHAIVFRARSHHKDTRIQNTTFQQSKAAARQSISDVDLCHAVTELELGQGDNLGGNVWKKRLRNNMSCSIVLTHYFLDICPHF